MYCVCLESVVIDAQNWMNCAPSGITPASGFFFLASDAKCLSSSPTESGLDTGAFDFGRGSH